MEVLKCGNCGGQLNYKEGDTIAKCSFCGYETNLKDIGEETVVRGIAISEQSKISTLIKRMSLLLEEEDFEKASEVADNILNLDPENADAYLGKLFIDFKVKNEKYITDKYIFLNSLTENKNYKRVIQFGNEKQKEKIQKAIENRKLLFKNISLTIKDRLVLSMSKIKESQKTFTFEKKDNSQKGCTQSGLWIVAVIMLFVFFPIGIILSIYLLISDGKHSKNMKENKIKTQLEKEIKEANSEIAYKKILEAPNNFDSKEKIEQFYLAYLIIDKNDYQNALNIVIDIDIKENKKSINLEKETKELQKDIDRLSCLKNSDEDPLNLIEEKIKEVKSELLSKIDMLKILLDKLDKICSLEEQLRYLIYIKEENYSEIDEQIKNLKQKYDNTKYDDTGIVTLYKDEIKKLV